VHADQPLSIYDPIKGCFVLNHNTPPVINAFHPDYVKTYMPEFMSAIRLEATQIANGVIAGGKSKAAREAKGSKTVNTVNLNPKPKFDIAPRTYHTYAKAGLPTGVKK